MSAQSGPDVAALLEVHAAHCVGNGVTWWAECLDVDCAWEKSGDVGGFPAGLAAHRAHLDQVIREAYADWLESEVERDHPLLSRQVGTLTHGGPDEFEMVCGRHGKWCETRGLIAYLADLLRGQA